MSARSSTSAPSAATAARALTSFREAASDRLPAQLTCPLCLTVLTDDRDTMELGDDEQPLLSQTAPLAKGPFKPYGK